jgi:D-sedoheptulose 7-phosphate isomerase
VTPLVPTVEGPTKARGNLDAQVDTISVLFQETARNLELVSKDSYVGEIHRAIELLLSCFSAGGKLLVFGNGGSSADAQHICAELVGRFMHERRALPAIALSANQAVLTAWSNDYGFDTVFSRQVEAFGHPGDIAWGISTSGNSPNVVEALKVARERGLSTIGLTGKGGGRMAPWCDVLMAVPLTETPRIQEIHVITYHAICATVESHLFFRIPAIYTRVNWSVSGKPCSHDRCPLDPG